MDASLLELKETIQRAVSDAQHKLADQRCACERALTKSSKKEREKRPKFAQSDWDSIYYPLADLCVAAATVHKKENLVFRAFEDARRKAIERRCAEDRARKMESSENSRKQSMEKGNGPRKTKTSQHPIMSKSTYRKVISDAKATSNRPPKNI